MAMDQKNLDDLVVDYLYGEMDSEQRAEFEAALSESPEVQRDIEALRCTRETVQKLEQLEPPKAISDALMREAERRAPRPAREGFLDKLRGVMQLLVMHPAMSAAATLVVVLGISFYIYRQGAPTPTSSLESDLPALGAPSGQATISSTSAMDKRESERGYARKAAAVPATSNADEVAPRAGAAKGLGGVARQKRIVRKVQIAQGESQQLAKQDKRIRTVASNAPAVRTTRRARPRAHRVSAEQRPLRKAKRSRRADRDSLDDLIDGAVNAGKRGKSGRAEVRNKRPAAIAQAARPAPPRKAASKPKTKKKARKKGGKATASTWLDLGHRAVSSKRCADAFRYYTRALRANSGLVSQISGKIGPCMGELRRARKSYSYLASRLHVAKQRYDYSETKRARKRRAKKRQRKPADKKATAK